MARFSGIVICLVILFRVDGTNKTNIPKTIQRKRNYREEIRGIRFAITANSPEMCQPVFINTGRRNWSIWRWHCYANANRTNGRNALIAVNRYMQLYRN